ncbi:hypothetical protein [Empedobacter sedimenti]|uniref:hypothetical protein n=1 Tax=Empedobacter sedimenti TaxID=3042610 RepID=UPI0024A6ACA5|nr:hypothetical protein [Empedobacter sedimenti]
MKIFHLILLLLFTSCYKIECDKLIINAKNRECLIIVNEFSTSQKQYLNIKGINLNDKTECTCKDEGRWWAIYRNEIEIGDTIIKRKGELTFNIYKKDTIISHEWECDGKTYNTDRTLKKF